LQCECWVKAQTISPDGTQFPELPAHALFASPKHANAIPASPTPNFLNAARRETDWAMLLASSSNLFMFFLLVPAYPVTTGKLEEPYKVPAASFPSPRFRLKALRYRIRAAIK